MIGAQAPILFPWKKRLGLLLAAGTAHALSFAPGLMPAGVQALLQLLALAVLVRCVMGAPRVRDAFAFGALFGVVTYAVGLYWLYISLHVYGLMVAPLAAGGVLALAAYLALYPALACALARRLAPWSGSGDTRAGHAPVYLLLSSFVWAGAWTLGEWLRGTILTGFSWLNIGYAHVDSPLAGWAPLLGVYGMTFLSAFTAAGLATLWRSRQGVRSNNALQSLTACVALLPALCGWGLAKVQWSSPSGQALRVDLIQGNVPQSQKFDPAQMLAGITTHLRLATNPVQGASAPDLILFPETVLPLFQDQLDPAVWATWQRLATERDTTLIMGAPLYTQRPTGSRVTNSVIAIDADTRLQDLRAGTVAQRYDKHHLVPFGEFVPTGFRWFVDAMQIPLGDFDRGDTRQPPFSIRDQRIAFNICYEDLFGEELLPALHPDANGAPGATILANVSNLGWFGDSWALGQHLQIARLRTLETARPMIAATNTGITAAIDHRAQVTHSLPTHQSDVLPVTVQGMSGLTPYAHTGNLPALLIALLAVLGGLVARAVSRSTSTKKA